MSVSGLVYILFVTFLFPRCGAKVLLMAAAALGSTDLEEANFCLACGDAHVLQLLSLMQILLLPLLPPTLQPLPRYRAWRTLFPRTAWTTAFWKTQRHKKTRGNHRPNTGWIVKGKERRVEGGWHRDTPGCAAWLRWCNHSVIPEQLAAPEAFWLGYGQS